MAKESKKSSRDPKLVRQLKDVDKQYKRRQVAYLSTMKKQYQDTSKAQRKEAEHFEIMSDNQERMRFGESEKKRRTARAKAKSRARSKK
tara:strand:+ start:523 stop:789 length:267 start_codon:yes stop_codon:yes gene_type:complete